MTNEEAIKQLLDAEHCLAGHGDLWDVDMEAFEMAIKALEHEPRKGHWIKGYTYPDGEYWECDKCNVLIRVRYPMHYCPNCGADMRESEE